MIKYVTGLLFSTDGKHVVLIQKNQPLPQKGLFNGLGGKVEFGETTEQAIAREVEEESGVKIPPNEWTKYVQIDRSPDYIVTFLFAYSDKAFQVRTMEAEKVKVYPIDKLPDNIIWNLRWLVLLAKDSSLEFSKPIIIQEKPKSSLV